MCCGFQSYLFLTSNKDHGGYFPIYSKDQVPSFNGSTSFYSWHFQNMGTWGNFSSFRGCTGLTGHIGFRGYVCIHNVCKYDIYRYSDMYMYLCMQIHVNMFIYTRISSLYIVCIFEG